MKERIGFVSNSSSSSFIVASKVNRATIIVPMEIKWPELGDEIRDRQELKRYFTDRYDSGWDEYEDILEWYTQCLKAIDKGHTIYAGFFDSNGDSMEEQYLCNKGIPIPVDDSSYKIIYNEAGY